MDVRFVRLRVTLRNGRTLTVKDDPKPEALKGLLSGPSRDGWLEVESPPGSLRFVRYSEIVELEAEYTADGSPTDEQP